MGMTLLVRLLVVLTMLALMAGCGQADDADSTAKNDAVEEKVEEKAADSTKPEVEMITTETGLRYQDLKVGEGAEAVNGMAVDVHYTLWLDADGKNGVKIDSSRDRDQLFPFTVGQPGLITGWNQGVVGMKPGGLRRIYIPSDLGYGPNGRPPMIPGGADLIFEMELVNIK